MVSSSSSSAIFIFLSIGSAEIPGSKRSSTGVKPLSSVRTLFSSGVDNLANSMAFDIVFSSDLLLKSLQWLKPIFPSTKTLKPTPCDEASSMVSISELSTFIERFLFDSRNTSAASAPRFIHFLTSFSVKSIFFMIMSVYFLIMLYCHLHLYLLSLQSVVLRIPQLSGPYRKFLGRNQDHHLRHQYLK